MIELICLLLLFKVYLVVVFVVINLEIWRCEVLEFLKNFELVVFKYIGFVKLLGDFKFDFVWI